LKAQLRAEFESALAKNSASWGIELGPDKNGFRASNSRFLPKKYFGVDQSTALWTRAGGARDIAFICTVSVV
jgi:hypothetical protein